MTDVAPETDFDAERAKAQVAAVSKLALPYLLDACDEIDRLHSLLLRAEEERDRWRGIADDEETTADDFERRLGAAEEERDRLQHIIDCADTPLMRDVMRERDACAELLRWQPHTERGLSNLHPQHRAAVERARALTAEETKEAENG